MFQLTKSNSNFKVFFWKRVSDSKKVKMVSISMRNLSIGIVVFSFICIIVSFIFNVNMIFPFLVIFSVSLIVLIFVFLEDGIPPIVHLICNVIWWILIAFTSFEIFSLIFTGKFVDLTRSYDLILVVGLIANLALLFYGMIVYWSFYREL